MRVENYELGVASYELGCARRVTRRSQLKTPNSKFKTLMASDGVQASAPPHIRRASPTLPITGTSVLQKAVGWQAGKTATGRKTALRPPARSETAPPHNFNKKERTDYGKDCFELALRRAAGRVRGLAAGSHIREREHHPLGGIIGRRPGGLHPLGLAAGPLGAGRQDRPAGGAGA